MTADEARDRVGDIRAGAARVMRVLSVPDIDWKAAEEAADECMRMCAELQARCWLEDFERRRYDSVYRQGGDHGGGAPQDGA